MISPVISQFKGGHLLDIGCGWEARLLKMVEPVIDRGVGIDFKAPNIATEKLKTMSVTLTKNLTLDSGCFDVVTMMAVLEHLDHPFDILCEVKRVLKKVGALVGTVPSKKSKTCARISCIHSQNCK
ncbi:class I SAM-dependent methyltransferase [Desulfovibrio sp. Huiquan2017]|uniref:class I SAM-dependent methyltransferase n=1 Tax=Desulfovibrio sp. Huiquan2017 TaxID=2816861 RepID=UPI001A92784A|nr:class I SAM-dependent methyltransferase [Desulfovibrio sp. Huiquan2017]